MKLPQCFCCVLVAATLNLLGCGKSSKPPSPPVTVNGTTVDLPSLGPALASAPAEVKTALSDAQFAMRYADYPRALADLNKIASNPSLTEDQKKSVNTVIEQLKQAASNSAPRAAQ